MRILIVLFISIVFPVSTLAQTPKNHKYFEKDYQRVWCDAHYGSMEVVLPDKARVDCVTTTHAIEFDFAKKWAESIGQAMYYGQVLKKSPGIVLIIEDQNKDQKYINRVKAVSGLYKMDLWTITPDDMQ